MIYFMYDFGNGTTIRRKKQKQKKTNQWLPRAEEDERS